MGRAGAASGVFEQDATTVGLFLVAGSEPVRREGAGQGARATDGGDLRRAAGCGIRSLGGSPL